VLEQSLDVFEPGDARHLLAGEQFPEQDHEAAVGNREIGPEHGAPIIFVATEVDHRRSGRRDEQPTAAGDFLDRLARGAAEEVEAEDRIRLQKAETLKLVSVYRLLVKGNRRIAVLTEGNFAARVPPIEEK
jgi:hypothetical protein